MTDPVVLTEIEQTKKGYALFCRGEFLFSLPRETFLEAGLREGMEMPEALLFRLREASEYRAAKAKALALLARRAHTKKELRDKIEQRFDPYTADAVAEEMERLGYLDDRAYAEECIRTVFVRRNMSAREAKRYLSERGIERETADELLLGYGEGDPGRIRLLLRRYSEKLASGNGFDNTFAALQRRGFSPSDIRAALAEMMDAAYREEE